MTGRKAPVCQRVVRAGVFFRLNPRESIMTRKTLLACALIALMTGPASLVMAQTPPPPAANAGPVAHPPMHDRKPARMAGFDAHHERGMRPGGGHHEDGGVIGALRDLEKLYMEAGRSKDLIAVYNEVLAKSQDPHVREYVYHRLAHLQAMPANVDQAISTMRKSLDESLANEAKMRVEHERMRAAWQQHRGRDMTPPPAPAPDSK